MEQQPPTQPPTRSPWFDAEPAAETLETPRLPAWRKWALAGTGSLALAGVVAGLTLANGAGADSSTERPASQTAAAQATTTTVAGEGDDQRGNANVDHEAERKQRLEETLQSLVDDGTLTTAQRDAVVAKLLESGPMGGGRGHGGPGRGGLGPKLDAAAAALGISEDDLRAELRDGSSIADVATERGVALDGVIDALVKEAQEHLADRPLPDGATAPTEAEIRERVTAMVNGEMPQRPAREGHGRGGDDGGMPGAGDGGGMPGGSGDTTTTTEN